MSLVLRTWIGIGGLFCMAAGARADDGISPPLGDIVSYPQDAPYPFRLRVPNDFRLELKVDKTGATLLDTTTGVVKGSMPTWGTKLSAVAITHDKQLFALGDENGRIRVFRCDDPPVEVAAFKHVNRIRGLHLADDGSQLAVVSGVAATVRAVDGSRSWVMSSALHDPLYLSADGRHALLRGTVWDVAKRRAVRADDNAELREQLFPRAAGDSARLVEPRMRRTQAPRLDFLGPIFRTRDFAVSDEHVISFVNMQWASAVQVWDRTSSESLASWMIPFDFEGPSSLAGYSPEWADMVDETLHVAFYGKQGVRVLRLHWPTLLNGGKRYVCMSWKDGAWDGMARWDPQADPLGELQRLQEGPSAVGIRNATSLTITSPMVDDDDLRHLTPVKNLRRLELASHFSDRGLVDVAAMTDLRELKLDGCRDLTSEGLKLLEKLPKLCKVELYSTGVDAAGVAALRRAKPECLVKVK